MEMISESEITLQSEGRWLVQSFRNVICQDFILEQQGPVEPQNLHLFKGRVVGD